MDSFSVSPALSENYSNIIIRTASLPDRPEAFSDLKNTALVHALSSDSGNGFFRVLNPAAGTTAGQDYPVQEVNQQYSILYVPLADHLSTVEEIGYPAVPKLYTKMNVVSLEAAGILPVRIRPSLDLSGAGVLVGILDSGIDYTHPAFRKADGTTRILQLWDQSDEQGTPPEGISYGTEYTDSQINEALFSGNPAIYGEPSHPESVQRGAQTDSWQREPGSQAGNGQHIAEFYTGSGQQESDSRRSAAPVPRTDPSGHGTAVAGIACGSVEASEGFTGVAPDCSIALVRLKPAKQYLRDYFQIPEGSIAYQEDDLMLGIRYLLDCAAQLAMPLVICLPLGTSQGGHDGHTPLENMLEAALYQPGVCVVTGTGNEVGSDHHYQNRLSREKASADIELLVDEETSGFSIELWADAPDLLSLGFTSPLGESIRPVSPAIGTSREFSFLLENSRIVLTWAAVHSPDASLVTLIRIADPTPGTWQIQISTLEIESGVFHLWLPAEGLVSPRVRFHASSADTTLVIPSCASSVISAGAWNAYDESLYLHSGRGYTRNGLIKPDFVSPGVRVTAPVPGGGYSSLTGSCAAAALTAGAAALLFEAGLKQNPPRVFSSAELKDLFRSGLRQSPSLSYPNQSWGYGILNVYGIFESLII
ncbi:MAG: S8 family serine peptidase [Clostridiales bacterium]|nr:S8 family serine peptidase [Clostridiales bacterium]